MYRENAVGRKSGITLAKNYGPRTWKSLAVFVVAACAAIHGQSSPKQMADPAAAAHGWCSIRRKSDRRLKPCLV
jgi:hypothetical protein